MRLPGSQAPGKGRDMARMKGVKPRYFQHEYRVFILSLSPKQAKRARAESENWPHQVWIREPHCRPGQCPHCVGGVRARDLELHTYVDLVEK
mgnify:CR=1 FL=1